MERLRLSVLGDFTIDGAITAIPLPGRKVRALIAYLALQPSQSQSREKLAALLWGSTGDAQARMNLRQALSSARKALGPHGWRLGGDGDRVTLDLRDADFDLARFEELAASIDLEEVERALDIYRGDLLDGFALREEPFEEWLRMERERLRASAVAAMEKLTAHHATAGNFSSCVRVAGRLLALEPLREDIHRTLMRAYAGQGRLGLALKQFEFCRDVLQRQLGLGPEPETRKLYDQLRVRRMAPARGPNEPNGDSPPHPGRAGPLAVRASRPLPQTRYVKSAGCNIAYQVTGEGAIDLVYVPGWVSNLDLAWESPRFAHVLQRLGTFSRLIRLDKRGTGLSDRNVGLPTLEERMDDLRAVLEAAGSKRAVLFGSSEGGNMCMLFAATYPERTAALVLHGSFAKGIWSEDYPWAKTPQEVQRDIAVLERDWGEPADLSNGAPSLMNDAFEREWFAAYLRNSASPADAISLWLWSTEIDTRDVMPAIRVPTLIVQRTGDRWVKAEEGRYLAERIAGAKYVELPGNDHLIWGEDSDRLVDEIEAFVTPVLPTASGEYVLATILCLEIVTASNGASGDQMLDGFHLHRTLFRREVQRADGKEIAPAGGGYAAIFQRPMRAVQCAIAIRSQLSVAGVEILAAVHIGECERRGDDYAGTALQVALHLRAQAKPGDIVTSRTIRDLVVGSGLVFEERGEMSIDGMPGSWQFLSVNGQPDR